MNFGYIHRRLSIAFQCGFIWADGSGAVFDAVGDMVERKEEYWAELCIDFAGGMGGLGYFRDCNIPGERC